MARNCILALWVGLIGSLLLPAQLTTGALGGTVKDHSGAPLPRVRIAVTDTDTGTSRSALTDSRGGYRIPVLPAGSYTVQATATGFRNEYREGVTLSAGQETVADFALSIENVVEEMTQPRAPTVKEEASAIGGLLPSLQLQAVPLNGRSLIELVPLQAGAVLADTGGASARLGFATKLAIGGTRFTSNSFLLDGSDINDASSTSGSVSGTMAGVDALREFRVITDAYDAELGHHTGGVISAITRSGTNRFHGSLFEFLRNDNLDARNFFDVMPGDPRRSSPAEFRRNQFGATAGGPLRRDRSFFFASYEGLREALGSTPTYEVPSLNMRAGSLYNVRYEIDPKIKPFLEAFHLPNRPEEVDPVDGDALDSLPTGVAEYVAARTQDTRQDYAMFRVDHRFSAADSLFGRLARDDSARLAPGLYTRERSAAPALLTTLEETHLAAPALVVKTQLSFNRTNFEGRDVPTEDFHFPQFSFTDQGDVPGVFTVPGLSGVDASTTNPKINIQNTWQFQEDLYYSAGRDAAKVGLQVEHLQYNLRSDFYGGGQYNFLDLESFLKNKPDSARFIAPGSDDLRGWRQNLMGLYFQDEYRLAEGLGVNLGLRYEFITIPHEAHGKVATIRDLRPQHLYTVTPAQTDVGDPYFVNPSLRNFAPRVGLAWSPFGLGKTAVRAGFGIFHEQILPAHYSVPGVRTAPFYSVAELFARDLQRNNVSLDFPGAFSSQQTLLLSSGGRPQVEGIEFQIAQPAVMKWTLDVQQQLSPGTLLEASYSATRGTHLDRGSLLLNSTPRVEVNGASFLAVDLPLPNPSWNCMSWRLFDGTSSYHALRLIVSKRFSRGVQFQAAYTYSKVTDDGSPLGGDGDWSNDRVGYRADKWHGLSAFDVRQSLYGTALYELPGRQSTTLAGKLLGGWSLSTLLRVNSGPPQTLTASRPTSRPSLGMSNSVQFVEGSSLDLRPGGDQDSIRPGDRLQYFDATQFLWPASFLTDPALAKVPELGNLIAPGNLGRGHLTAPGIVSWDLALMRDIPFRRLGEDGTLQIRGEFFNILNKANFGFPDGNVFDSHGRLSSTAGRISDTRGSARQIQLAVKIVF